MIRQTSFLRKKNPSQKPASFRVKVLEKLKYGGILIKSCQQLFLVLNKTKCQRKSLNVSFWHLSFPMFLLSKNFKCNYLNNAALVCCCYSRFLVQIITVGSKNSHFRKTTYKIIKRHTNLVSFFVCNKYVRKPNMKNHGLSLRFKDDEEIKQGLLKL